jgi:hypothetical protein
MEDALLLPERNELAGLKDYGNDPRVGLPRKDDSTSVYNRVVACQLDSLAPTLGLPERVWGI